MDIEVRKVASDTIAANFAGADETWYSVNADGATVAIFRRKDAAEEYASDLRYFVRIVGRLA